MKEIMPSPKGFKRFLLTDEECQKLLTLGQEALAHTYPTPNKGFAVALLTLDKHYFTGASYGSDTATLTMHSEATALTNAANHGETKIIAITGPNCHICKQLIYESSLRSGIDTTIIIEEDDQIKQLFISDLMPYPWPEKI